MSVSCGFFLSRPAFPRRAIVFSVGPEVLQTPMPIAFHVKRKVSYGPQRGRPKARGTTPLAFTKPPLAAEVERRWRDAFRACLRRSRPEWSAHFSPSAARGFRKKQAWSEGAEAMPGREGVEAGPDTAAAVCFSTASSLLPQAIRRALARRAPDLTPACAARGVLRWQPPAAPVSYRGAAARVRRRWLGTRETRPSRDPLSVRSRELACREAAWLLAFGRSCPAAAR